MKNANLHKAKNAKNDEFYTQLTDVSKELMHYKQHFKGKDNYKNFLYAIVKIDMVYACTKAALDIYNAKINNSEDITSLITVFRKP